MKVALCLLFGLGCFVISNNAASLKSKNKNSVSDAKRKLITLLQELDNLIEKKSKAASVKETVNLEFETFDIEEELHCTFDALCVYDGFDNSAPKLGCSCGDVPPYYASTSDVLFVQFTTDESVRKDGFKASWSFVDMDENGPAR